MALFTASNLTAEAELKKPEPGRKYSRAALSALDKTDQERWFVDPRLDEKYQLPDIFYVTSHAFDRGHIVRRDDVAWGETYDLLRRANGDSYHLTNCSPQVPAFNRSNLGEDNWGDLENHILKSASRERYCEFAGPLFDDKNDDVFVGRGGGRTRLRVKIPSRYWKVIVARTTNGVVSYGFVLEQDLSKVDLEEFIVPNEFQRFMEPLAELQDKIGIKFPTIVLDGDQYDKDEGVDVAFRASVRRRAGGKEAVVEEIVP
jgi:endonuclease G